MKLKNVLAWEEFARKYQEPEIVILIKFAALWANKIEEMMSARRELQDVAFEALLKIDPEIEISDTMQWNIVSILHQAWEHGEELRIWYNLINGGTESDEGVRDQHLGKPESVLIVNPAPPTHGLN
jgi:hypothetical protein